MKLRCTACFLLGCPPRKEKTQAVCVCRRLFALKPVFSLIDIHQMTWHPVFVLISYPRYIIINSTTYVVIHY